MIKSFKNRWLAFWLSCCTAVAGVFVVHAVVLDLDAFVSFSILDEALNSLPDGALVYVIGSGDNVVLDPGGMYVVPTGGGTNLTADSTTGDDQILGSVRIGDNNSSNGTFTTTLQYDPAEISYVYIRFFNWTNPGIPTGIVFWGTSAVFELVPTLGVARVDFNPTAGGLETTNQNNFVIIPEPGTGNLMLLFFAMLGGIRARMKRHQKEEEKKKQESEPV